VAVLVSLSAQHLTVDCACTREQAVKRPPLPFALLYISWPLCSLHLVLDHTTSLSAAHPVPAATPYASSPKVHNRAPPDAQKLNASCHDSAFRGAQLPLICDPEQTSDTLCMFIFHLPCISMPLQLLIIGPSETSTISNESRAASLVTSPPSFTIGSSVDEEASSA